MHQEEDEENAEESSNTQIVIEPKELNDVTEAKTQPRKSLDLGGMSRADTSIDELGVSNSQVQMMRSETEANEEEKKEDKSADLPLEDLVFFFFLFYFVFFP